MSERHLVIIEPGGVEGEADGGGFTKKRAGEGGDSVALHLDRGHGGGTKHVAVGILTIDGDIGGKITGTRETEQTDRLAR